MEFNRPLVSSFRESRIHFECHLEGIDVPFTQIDIVEQEQGHPTAQITFPAISGALRVLPSTIVQIFGPADIKENEGPKKKGLVLLFEGEVTGVAYQKAASGRMVTLQAESLLNQLETASVTPVDQLVPQKLGKLMGGSATNISVHTLQAASAAAGTLLRPISDLKAALATSAGGDAS